MAQSYDILLKLIPLIAAVILLISIIGAVICSRYYSKPLVGISNVAKRMTTLDMTWKCDVRRKDEIGVLSSSLNEMSQQLSNALDSLQAANEQLQQDIEREREQEKQRVDFFTSVSHELKTPIAIIKGQLEGMIHQVGPYKDRDTYLRRCLKTTNDMEALVKEILSAARMAVATSTWNARTWTSAKCCNKVCQQFRGGWRTRRWNCTWTSSRPSTMRAMGGYGEVFTNVIGNAVAYSPVGATVTVSLQNGIFFVENSGIHIAEEDLKQIFTPFYGWTNPGTGTAAAAALGCILPRPSWITMGYSTVW